MAKNRQFDKMSFAGLDRFYKVCYNVLSKIQLNLCVSLKILRMIWRRETRTFLESRLGDISGSAL
jgi:hypothetical protein